MKNKEKSDMKKNQVKLVVAGMFVLVFMTACGSKDTNVNEGLNSIISEEIEDVAHSTEEQESGTDTGTRQTEESSQLTSQSTESTDAEENIEEELADYRAEREKGTSSHGNYTMVELPNEENYNNKIGDSNDYTSRFDSRELNEAFEVAEAYVEDTLHLESEVWSCIDPRMLAIYEDEDKGVASGYDADNIFLCEFNNNGSWQYLILVREGKGSDWEVLYQGSSYKNE
jgi:ABC-type Fe3+-citrate transport system substrate-binding protein